MTGKDSLPLFVNQSFIPVGAIRENYLNIGHHKALYIFEVIH